MGLEDHRIRRATNAVANSDGQVLSGNRPYDLSSNQAPHTIGADQVFGRERLTRCRA
jgi:hypothetical protein